MQGSARKDVVFGAAGVYPVTVPGPKWKSWVKRLVICAAENVISAADLSERIRGAVSHGDIGASCNPGDETTVASKSPLDSAMEAYEKRLLFDALQRHGGNQVHTAKALGLSRQGLIKKMKRHGISRSDFRSPGA